MALAARINRFAVYSVDIIIAKKYKICKGLLTLEQFQGVKYRQSFSVMLAWTEWKPVPYIYLS